MALQLETVIFTGMSEATAAAYTAALRVGLDYSAFETLASAVPELKGSLVTKNKKLADSVLPALPGGNNKLLSGCN